MVTIPTSTSPVECAKMTALFTTGIIFLKIGAAPAFSIVRSARVTSWRIALFATRIEKWLDMGVSVYWAHTHLGMGASYVVLLSVTVKSASLMLLQQWYAQSARIYTTYSQIWTSASLVAHPSPTARSAPDSTVEMWSATNVKTTTF